MKNTIPWQLIINHLKGELTPGEDVLFGKWIAEENNKQLFDELKHLWDEVRADGSQHDPDVSHYWKIMDARINSGIRKKRRTSYTLVRMAALAASVALIAVLSYLYIYTGNGSEQINSYAVLSGKSFVVLPDSSTVWLNSGSKLSYGGNFARNRLVEMQGEASFDVRKDAKHPFMVTTSGVKVKVYGTYFNINSYQDEEDITVTLRDGSVALVFDNKESLLKPGQKAIINKKDETLSIVDADLDYELFWANNSIAFEGKPLGYICTYLEKWYNVNIEVDPDIAEKQIYTFKIENDPLETILRIMSKISPIQYSFDKDNNVTITKVKP